tara:strand:- start:787 stop:1134 length:348 start_codon:yes stop_codon:yes gene_type:complete
MTESQNNFIKTDWGYILHWANHEDYSAKIYVFESAEAQTEMQFHKDTHKTFFVNAGRFILQFIETTHGTINTHPLNEGDTISVPAMTPYNLKCITPHSSITEVASQNYSEDIYKI